MSWWDTKGLTSLATQALKSAQKKIDKVLDIEEEKNRAAKLENTESASPKEEEGNSWNSWNSWLGYGSPAGDDKVEVKEVESSGSKPSSWGMPWGTQVPLLSSNKSLPDVDGAANVLPSLTFKPVNTSRKAGSQNKTDPASEHKVVREAEQLPAQTSAHDTDVLPVKDRTVDGGDSVKNAEESLSIPSEDACLGQAHSVPETFVTISCNQREEQHEVEHKDLGKHPASHGQGHLVINEQKSKGDSIASTGQNNSKVKALSPLETSEIEYAFDGLKESCRKSEMQTWGDEERLQFEQAVDVQRKEMVVSSKSQRDVAMCPERSGEGGCQLTSYEEQSEKQSCEVEDSVLEAVSAVDSHTPDSAASLKSVEVNISESEQELQIADADSEVRFSEDALEIISRNASEDVLESFDTAAALSDCALECSADSSDAALALSIDLKIVQTSVTSSSSDAVMLSVSSEDASITPADLFLPEVDTFGPLSHSSLVEDEGEDKSPPFDSSLILEKLASGCPQVESTTTVSSNDSSETSRLDSSMDTVVDKGQQQIDLEGETCDVDGEQWLGLEQSAEGELSGPDSSSPSASFVKCLIEEAMEEAAKVEDSGSDNHSEEKSESSKIDSELEKSTHSGLESSDEIETTTSSDIEIISTPTPNGEKNAVDLSPLKFSLQKAAHSRSHSLGHQRSDSQSSSSTHSKGDEQLSPERDSDQERHVWQREGKTQQHNGAAMGNDDLDNPQHPQRLLKTSLSQQERDIVKKLAEMAEILQARETKLVQLSHDNNDLLETNSILRSQLQQLEEAREAEMTDLNTLTEEFTRRMGDAERKLQNVLKEKEALKQQLQEAEQQLAKRAGDVKLQELLTEKDEQIAGLLEEGEKLSKQQLQNSNIIKKLRAKEKENEMTVAAQKKKIDQQTEELDHLKKVLDSKEEMEKKQTDAIRQLNSAVQMLEKEKAKLAAEVELANEKIRGLQVTLDNSYKEIAELHKSNAAQDSKAQAAALSAEMQVREELKMSMEQEQQYFKHQRDSLIMQIEDLQLSMTRMEKEHNRREELLKQEIAELQLRLQEDECRNQDLTQSVTSATRPLLRQIENLRATHSLQTASWEMVEKSLTDRLSEAQTLLALAQERERAATEKLTEMTSRCTALEATNTQLRQDKAHLLTQLESDRRRIDMLEERKASDIAQLELAKQKLSDEVATLKKNQVFLESQLETERGRVETERQRVAVAEEQIHMLERERPRSRGSPSPVSVSRQESMNNSFSEHAATPIWSLQKSMQDDFETNLMVPAGPKLSVYESLRQTGAAAIMENLQSQLKLREGEIAQLQADIQQLEHTRESMARELVSLTNLNEELQEQVLELPKLENQYKELDARYNALLQMYGEKEEQVQELQLDLQDVKDMYKSQINALMPK